MQWSYASPNDIPFLVKWAVDYIWAEYDKDEMKKIEATKGTK